MSKQEVFAAQASYEASLAAYEAHRHENKDIIEEHDHLAVALGEALEELKSKLRENYQLFGSQFGSFSISVPRKYSYEKLKQLLGDSAEPYTVTRYTVNADAFNEAVKNGIIKPEVADEVIGKDSPRISGGPKPPSIFQR